MTTNISKIITVICICLMTSCSDKVDFGEQYKKTVYIVNSTLGLHTGQHFFDAVNDEIVISVYCASTKPITSDLRTRFKIDRQALDSLNNFFSSVDPSFIAKVMLPPENYQLDGELYTTIDAGAQYGTLRIPFHFTGLDPDIAYTLPVTLVSNSADYDINPQLRSIVYEVKMENQYSGEYAGSSQESPTVVRGVLPVLKALNVNTVRMPIHNLSDDRLNINTNFMVLTIANNGSVEITPWANANVTDLGESFYDAASQTFELNYEFTNTSGNTFTISQIITNINKN